MPALAGGIGLERAVDWLHSIAGFRQEEFDEDRAEAFARAKEAGVGKVFLPAIDGRSLPHPGRLLSQEILSLAVT